MAIGIPILVLCVAYKPFIKDQAERDTFNGDVKKYQLARKLGAKSNLNDDLWLAARWGHYDLVEYLISAGANVNARLSGER